MKRRLCILVIASRSSDINGVTQYNRYGLYDQFVELFWVPIIQRIKNVEHIDCFLLYNSEREVKDWNIYEQYLKDNVLFDVLDINTQDNTSISIVPGILTKQLSSFKLLCNKYDVFWNCNLSSIPHIERLDQYIQDNVVTYSGHYVFFEEIRNHLRMYRYPADVASLLDMWSGRTFLGGSGFFINQSEVFYIVELLEQIRENDILYILNDLVIGLSLIHI